MKIIQPHIPVDVQTWPTPGAKVVKNGSPASSLHMIGADAAGAYCLWAGFPNAIIHLNGVPDDGDAVNYADFTVLMPPFADRMQIGAVVYASAVMTSAPYVQITSGLGATYLIPGTNLPNDDATTGEDDVEKWVLSWGAASDSGALANPTLKANGSEPIVGSFRVNVTEPELKLRALIFRFMRSVNTL